MFFGEHDGFTGAEGFTGGDGFTGCDGFISDEAAQIDLLFVLFIFILTGGWEKMKLTL